MKRALLIGIDAYQNFNDLGGCVADVKAVQALLARNADGTRNFECRTLIGGRDSVTRRDMLVAVEKLLGPGADIAVFYFAGHGRGEKNDVSLVAENGDTVEPGLPLSVLFGKVQSSTVREVIVILDACHSGGAGGVPQLGDNVALLRPGVTVFAASRSDQTAAETTAGRGLFSTHLCAALEGAAADTAGRLSVVHLYAYLSECFGAWEQRPTFKANLNEALVIRHCAPMVPLLDIQAMAQFFQNPDAEFQLDPRFDPDTSTDPDGVAIGRLLATCRNGQLLHTPGTDLYHAIMAGGTCVLTARGKHYWQLVSDELL